MACTKSNKTIDSNLYFHVTNPCFKKMYVSLCAACILRGEQTTFAINSSMHYRYRRNDLGAVRPGVKSRCC